MAKATVSKKIDAPIDRVWELLADLEHWSAWAPLSARDRVVSRTIAGGEGEFLVCDVEEQVGLANIKMRAKYILSPKRQIDEETVSGEWIGRATLKLLPSNGGTAVTVDAEGSPHGTSADLAFFLEGGDRTLAGFWNEVLGQLASMATSPCSLQKPMYCPSRMLDIYYTKPSLGLDVLVNHSWREIDLSTLTIYDALRWRGIYPPDSVPPPWVFQNGFNKVFTIKAGQVSGITSTFDDTINGNNRPVPIDPEDPSKGVLLEYTDPQYSEFYDILKVVSQDIVVGKAFVGTYPQGRLLLNFTMARRYSFDFMSAQDHRELFEKYGKEPDVTKITGEWEGRMVSNASLTPPLFRFWYSVDPSGKVSCQWNFMNILKGRSRIEMTKDQMLMFDFTNFHDEIRMLTPDAMVGRYLPQSSKLLDIIGDRDLGLLHFEKNAQGDRPMIYYYIKRVPGTSPPPP
jgi:uncharacterized protein YndB with AHSA1/START domain